MLRTLEIRHYGPVFDVLETGLYYETGVERYFKDSLNFSPFSAIPEWEKFSCFRPQCQGGFASMFPHNEDNC